MPNILAIFRREFWGAFDAPLAYIAVTVFLVLVGGFTLFFQDLLTSGVATLRPMFFWCAVFYLLLIPAVTMRLLAEERRTGTLEILSTLPVTEAQIVLGKYLSALALMTVALALTATYPITLATLGDLDGGTVVGGYLGLFLLGAALTAIGTAASAYTGNQVVAFLVALLVSTIPFATGFALDKVPSAILPLVQVLSFDYHFNNLARGVVDSRDLIFYLGVVALFLQLAIYGLERRRLS